MQMQNGKRLHVTVGASFLTLVMILVIASQARAHCEIPCGIYDDKLRIVMLDEDITTIEKAMRQILSLSAESPVNHNQLVRWIANKDDHANRIQETVSQYFMTQRINPVADRNGNEGRKYLQELSLLHGLLVHAMKAKQTTDLDHVQTMRDLLREFADSYLSEQDRKHLKDHHDF